MHAVHSGSLYKIREDRLQTLLLLLLLRLYCQALPLLMLIILCPPSVSWDRTTSVYFLVTVAHWRTQTLHLCAVFSSRSALTMRQTGSLSGPLRGLHTSQSPPEQVPLSASTDDVAINGTYGLPPVCEPISL